ncbi:MAG: hypothetical protein VX899_16575 [Myxococcota bacterium]|nr:hypothetical protein [Myxococcota bacterium]
MSDFTPLWTLQELPTGRVLMGEQDRPLRRVLILEGQVQGALSSWANLRGAGLPYLLDGGPGRLIWEHSERLLFPPKWALPSLAAGLRSLHAAGLAHGALLELGVGVGSDGRARLWCPGLGEGDLKARQQRDLHHLDQWVAPHRLTLGLTSEDRLQTLHTLAGRA